jgi:hypothetical protein
MHGPVLLQALLLWRYTLSNPRFVTELVQHGKVTSLWAEEQKPVNQAHVQDYNDLCPSFKRLQYGGRYDESAAPANMPVCSFFGHTHTLKSFKGCVAW